MNRAKESVYDIPYSVLRTQYSIPSTSTLYLVNSIQHPALRGLYSVLSTQYSVLSTRYLWLAVCGLPLGLLLLAGCDQTAPPPDAAPAVSSTAAPSHAKINLIRADAKKLAEIVASHKGQVVLVDYWATWCGPCVENFPHTVELAKKYKDQGLATISVSFDLFEDEPSVRKFLAEQGADFENLISQHNAIGQKPAVDFDISPLPVYRLYDRQGKLNQTWEGMPEGAILEDKIQELLAAPPDAGK